ncbi:MAG: hypothetical protein D6755_01875 [Anaerolineae bacterium]|nr:MAG: hypothetical protein D6755_01875 [Anaerolineae bacterium]
MTLSAAVGQYRSLDGHEAAEKAAHQALEQLAGVPLCLGVVIFSQAYEVEEVLSGVTAVLGNTPLLGFCTPAELSQTGQMTRSVVVALLGGTEVHARADWWENFAEDSGEVTRLMVDTLRLHEQTGGALLVFTDGLRGDSTTLNQQLPRGFQVAGAATGGDFYRGRSFQIGGGVGGNGGIAAALLEGRVLLGIGSAHGWEPIGTLLEVTHSRGMWVRTLDNKPASEKYAEVLGYEARDWLFPPLNRLVRLYPLGVERHGSEELDIRTPIRMEADGSLRMNISVTDGASSYLMVGSAEACQRAAQQATQQALEALGGARPVLALVLVDVAWQMLMDSDPGREIAVVDAVLGGKVPVAGGYVLGQIDRQSSDEAVRVRNQHIQVVIFGEV